MTDIKTFRIRLVALLVALGFYSCFFPEKFEAYIDLKKDGTYSLTYDGILTFLPARGKEVTEGKLTADDERELKKIEQELLREQNFKKASYIGHSQFKVLYKEEGKLISPVYFLSSEAAIISILPLGNREVEIRGMKLGEQDIKELQKLNMEVEGRLEVSTNAKVVTHNANRVPKLFGLLGSYTWQIKSVSDTAPYMLIKLQ